MKTIVAKSKTEIPDREAPNRGLDRKFSLEQTAASANAPRRLTIVFALLCLLGLAISVELTRIHVFVHTNPKYHSICAVSEGVNCETVAGSPYSVYLGLPVAVWGMLAYLTMGLFALSGLSQRRLHATWPWGILLLLSTVSVIGSIALAYISVTQISSVCLFCMASYLVNIALLVLSVVATKRQQLSVLRAVIADWGALLDRPMLAGVLTLVGASLIGVAEGSVPPYWSRPGWSELPKLTDGIDQAGQHWLGGCNPILTIVEFSDYECPHCRAAHKQIRELAAKHQKEIRLVHRHLPLDVACHPGIKKPFHTHACLFAEAAECAGRQGQFWEMNDALFSMQETAKAENVDPMALAVRLGLNRADYWQCLSTHATLDKVILDIREAIGQKLEGTPSFLIGDRVYVGSIPEAEIERLLQPHNTQGSPEAEFPAIHQEVCDGSRTAGIAGSTSR